MKEAESIGLFIFVSLVQISKNYLSVLILLIELSTLNFKRLSYKLKARRDSREIDIFMSMHTKYKSH